MSRARILVVDDEPGMLRAVERILGTEHLVISTANPFEALEIAGTERPDIVICDVSMPKLDGFEVMSRLKELRSDIDVILMTGMSEPDQHLVRAIREKAFYFIEKPFNREVMRTIVDRCLELRRLREAEHRYTQRVNRELNEARAFQQTMLPSMRATVQGIKIDAQYRACSELAGDIFDYAPAGDGRAALLIADVSGHGVCAALLTGVVKSAFQSSSAEQYAPLAVVQRVNEGIRTFSNSRFVTLISAIIDRISGELRYVNAGHPSGLLQRAKGPLAELPSTGAMISPALADETWECVTVPIRANDRLVLYTDGVTDARGPEGQYSNARLHDRITASRTSQSELLGDIVDSVTQFTQGRALPDDLTLLAASF